MKRPTLGILGTITPHRQGKRFVLGLIVLANLIFPACSKTSSEDSSEVSEISINELGVEGYDRFELEMSSNDANFKIPLTSFSRGNRSIDMKVVPGTYKIRLDYFQGEKLVFGADLCSANKKNNIQTFVAGQNPISINICSSENTGPIQPINNQTFSIKGGQLIDPKGFPFVMRGVNIPAAYHYDKTMNSLPRIKQLGFNTVRIVWCADNLIVGGRCDNNHIFAPAKLEQLLSKIRQQKLVAVLNLQNATGSNKKEDLQKMTSYLLKPEIKSILLRYQDMLIVNIANEWYGTWDKSTTYVTSYKDAIKDLRAEIPHVLMIDARGYGQDTSSISEHGAELINTDIKRNIIISAHLYDDFRDETSVQNLFALVRRNKWAFAVGEFACSHGNRGRVACDAIMREAANSSFKIGTIAWSLTGNSGDLVDLDILSGNDWSSLTDFGNKIVRSQYGVEATSKEACFFSASSCQ